MTETRNYVVLGREPGTEAWSAFGSYADTSPEDAIRQAVAERPAQAEGVSVFAAVSERNWVELPVVREVQTKLRIGEREFVLDGAEAS